MQVVVAKMNPVNDYLGPLLRRAFEPFVERGFVEFAYGGPGARQHALPQQAAVGFHGAAIWAGGHLNGTVAACPRLLAAVGKALCEHPVVESIHLTGSADTYNAIVWGSKDAPVRPRRRPWGTDGVGGRQPI